jgi:hypothetical protein
MENGEIIQRVVGVLTQTAEVYRLLREDPDRNDEELDAGTTVISDLVSEVLRAELVIPANASPQEVVNIAVEALREPIYQLLAASAFAFVELAEVHDAGRSDVSSAEVLRRLALKAEEN